MVISFYFFPSIIQAVSFSTFLGTGGELDMETAFAVLTIFNIITGPMRFFPMFIGSCIEFHVSVVRI